MTIFAEIFRLLDSILARELQALARGAETLAAQRDEAAAGLKAAREQLLPSLS